MNLFIDTNIYLDFFHFSKDDLIKLEELVLLATRGDIKLILPEQVVHEFTRNRENKISASMERFTKKVDLTAPQICKGYVEFNDCKTLQKDLNRKLNELQKKLDIDIKSRSLKADTLIKNLFERSVRIPNSNTLLDKSRIRVEIGNPPGKKGGLGDAIIWESLLENKNSEGLHFISDDKDYKSSITQYKMKDYLSDEWERLQGTSLDYYHNLGSFLGKHFPDINLSSEKEKDDTIEKLSQSNEFAVTHSLIAKLNKYSEFTPSQLNTLAGIFTSNHQVYWIIDDEDVNLFAREVILKEKEKLDDELVLELEELLTAK
jgi:predicted nucleic acid-binding protein